MVFWSQYQCFFMSRWFTSKRFSTIESAKNILFIESSKIKILLRYRSDLIVAFIGHKNDFILEIIGIISSCDMVLCVFIEPTKNPSFYYCPKYIKWLTHLRGQMPIFRYPFAFRRFSRSFCARMPACGNPYMPFRISRYTYPSFVFLSCNLYSSIKYCGSSAIFRRMCSYLAIGVLR